MAETAYGFNTRFGAGNPNASRGTNPEELIAAAPAACFTMSLSNALAQAGPAPAAVATRPDVDPSMAPGPTISAIRLPTKATVPGIAAATSRAIAHHHTTNAPRPQAPAPAT